MTASTPPDETWQASACTGSRILGTSPRRYLFFAEYLSYLAVLQHFSFFFISVSISYAMLVYKLMVVFTAFHKSVLRGNSRWCKKLITGCNYQLRRSDAFLPRLMWCQSKLTIGMIICLSEGSLVANGVPLSFITGVCRAKQTSSWSAWIGSLIFNLLKITVNYNQVDS